MGCQAHLFPGQGDPSLGRGRGVAAYNRCEVWGQPAASVPDCPSQAVGLVGRSLTKVARPCLTLSFVSHERDEPMGKSRGLGLFLCILALLSSCALEEDIESSELEITLPIQCRMTLDCSSTQRCRWLPRPGEDSRCGNTGYDHAPRYCYNIGHPGQAAPRCCKGVFWRNIRGNCRMVCQSGRSLADDVDVYMAPSCATMMPPPYPFPVEPSWPPAYQEGRPAF